MGRTRFEYRDLNSDTEFRTLKILGKRNGFLRCQLTHHPLPKNSDPDVIKYDAVSWYWGSGDVDMTSIYIIGTDEYGRESDKVFAVRPKLVETLEGLWGKTPSEELWIDALCIHQDNHDERDLQVQHMFEIYSCAQNVCIWLGDHDDENNSRLALKFIKERVCDLGAFEKITKEGGAKDEFKALAALMNRNWFSRRWVVQELALAKRATVHCGPDWIEWSDFETAVALFERDAPKIAMQWRGSSSAEYDPDLFGDVRNMRATRLVHAKSNLFRMNDRGQIMEFRFSLSDLVSNLSFFEAGEPHDLIYAILSLAQDTHYRMRTVRQARGQNSNADTPESHDSPVTETSPAFLNANGLDHNAFQDAIASGTNPLKRKFTFEEDDQHLKVPKTAKEKVVDKLQLIKKGLIRFPPVDYKQPFFKLCQQFLEFTIPRQEYPNLDIICRPWAPQAPERERELPSWIPLAENAAFTSRIAEYAPSRSQVKRKNPDPLVGQTTYETSSYNACRSIKLGKDDWKFGNKSDNTEHSLFVTGFVLDQIGQLEAASQSGHVPLDWIHMGGWRPWTKRGERNHSSQLPDELWRTLVADRGPDGGNTKIYYRRAFEYAVTRSTPDVGIQTAELKQRGNSILIELLDRMEAVVWNRRLFRSKRDDNLGLAPKKSMKGDYICVLRGCSVPVILRKYEESPGFEFIGECYLHTMMNGQAVDIQERTVNRWKADRAMNGGEISLEEKLMTTQLFELR